MMPCQLDYESLGRRLVRPWHLWVGATVAVVWLLTVAAVLAVLLGRAVLRNGTDATGFGLASFATLVCCCISLLGLVMEWRALVRYSANAAAGVGILMAIFAVLALLATLLGLISYAAKPMDIVLPAVIAIALAFAAFAHIRWAMLVLRWQGPLLDDSTPRTG